MEESHETIDQPLADYRLSIRYLNVKYKLSTDYISVDYL